MSFEYDLGILGGGQLARMSVQAAQRIGLRCLCLDESGADSPAGQVGACLAGSIYDSGAIAQVLQQAKNVTLENEFIPAATIADACKSVKRDESTVMPGLATLATIQDKWLQRQAYDAAGLPSPKAITIDITNSAIPDVLEKQFGFPLVAKARRGGYDGKGTRTIRSRADLNSLITKLKKHQKDPEWMVEAFVSFRREIAVMVYRDATTEGVFPTMETIQTDHVCDLVFPAGVDASEIALAAVQSVNGFGLFGVELFELGDGSFSVNEIAPRPHNTGHYTLDWGGVSQFEQHVRLAMKMTPSPPRGMAATMANLLGQPEAGDWQNGLKAALQLVPHAHVHWYGKHAAKPGRKMGHINVVGENSIELAVLARNAFYAAWTAR